MVNPKHGIQSYENVEEVDNSDAPVDIVDDSDLNDGLNKDSKIKDVGEDSEKKSNELAAALNLFKVYVGSGLLTMPFAFKNSGILLGSITCFILFLASMHCIILLVQAKAQAQVKTYGQVAYTAFGSIGTVLVDVFLLFTQTGFSIAYLIFIVVTFVEEVKDFEPYKIVWFTLLGLSLIPFVLVKHMKNLSIVSLLGEIILFLSLVIIFVFDATSFNLDTIQHHVNWIHVDWANFSTALGIQIYAWEGIGCVTSVQHSMKRRKNFLIIGPVVILFYGLLMLVFGIVGYLAYGDQTNQVITKNLGEGIFVIIFKILLCLSLYFTYPIQMFPATEIIDEHIGSLANRLRKKFNVPVFFEVYILRNIHRILMVGLTVLIGFGLFQYFEKLLSFIGGIGGTFLAFVAPALFHTKIFWGKSHWLIAVKNILIAVFGFGIMIFCLVDNIRQVVVEIKAST